MDARKTPKNPKQPSDADEAQGEWKQRFQSLVALSSEWYWEQDEDYRFTLVTGSTEGHSGIGPEKFVGTYRWDRGTVPVSDGGSWDSHKAVLEARQPFTDFVFKRLDEKGELHYINTNGQPTFDEKKRFTGYRGSARDISQRVQMDLRLIIEHAVTRVLEESNSLAEAAPQIIQVICETLEWACGSRWELERDQAIRCAETWGVTSAGIDAFLEVTRRQSPSTQPGGLNRRIWSERKPVWIRDVTQEATFRRAPDAIKAGLHSAFAFPINVGAEVIGVMEFFSQEIHQPDVELLECMTYVGSQIGQFMQRKRAEEEQRRFRAAIDVSADLVLLVDPENMRYVDVNDAACRALGYSREELLAMGPPDILSLSREELARIYERLIAGDPGETAAEVFFRRKDGSRFVVESSRGVVPSAKGNIIVAVARDVGERRRAEQLRKLEHTVTRALAEADSAPAALEAAIRALCETEDWECGRYFRVDEKAGLLRFAEAWSVPGDATERFIAGSHELTYAPGAGLAGRAWQTGQPVWVADIAKDGRVAQVTLARETGMHGAFVFPVMSERKVIGVLTFNSREVREPEDLLLQAISVIGSQIGQFVQRKQAEKVLRESEESFRALTELSSDMYWTQDSEHRFVTFSGSNKTLPLRLIGKHRWDEESFNMTEADWTAHKATMNAHQPFRDIELGRRSEAGETFWVSVSGAPVFDDSGVFIGYRGLSKNITERKRAEELQALEHAVTRALAETDGVAEALKAAMRVVCETLGWECGRYFRMDDAAGVFRYAESWYVPNPELDSFIKYSIDKTFVPGVGVVGKAGAGEPQWVANLAADPRVVNPFMASGHGMRGAFMFPVMSDGKALGVLSFTSRKIREPDARLLQAVRVIGAQMGQFLQRKKAEDVVRENEERFRSLTELSSDMYWEQDDQFRFTSMGGTGSARVNTRSFLSIGKKRWEQNYINMTADQWAEHIAALEAHKPFRDMELCRLDDTGKKLWVSISGEPVFDPPGTFRGYRGVGKDISERKQDEERIQFLANHDALTSLPNRAMFSEVLNIAIQNARRYNRNFAVLFIDLDRFKNINDTLGHDAGDKLLQEMGTRLVQTVRSSDVVARLGGDEFVVLVQEVADPKQVAAVARKILSTLVQPMFMQGQECRVTASIGVCMYPSEAQDEKTLMKNADIAMYRAKEDGKNNYKFYSEEINIHTFERLALETSLRRGLERNEFFLHYQAKLDLHTKRITGVEALLRWQHPELGMVSPLQFIPLAEETGLIVPIGKWVLNTACAQNVAWQQEGLPPLCMAVNLSARQFADEELVKDIADVLHNTGLQPALLELELTESMVIQSPERAGKVLAEIHKMGVRLAIDDFGVGYSSLTHLKRFPIDTLKVDRSFIRDLPQDPEDRAICEAIIAMGKSLNLTVIAEGVETLEQQTFLQDHACDEMQGFLFSKPIPSDQFAELLRQRIKSPQ
ncbi:MAG TPA: EAL domain-containing protein [Burkholderiales bacterium]|nr:EAL domain-containing protein [Burkholderiales bacterium]